MNILVVTDCWHPQVNGIVRIYEYLALELETMGHKVKIIEPGNFSLRLQVPFFPKDVMVFFPYSKLKKICDNFSPNIIHIGTEGTLGRAAQRYCRENKLFFSTFYHTNIAEYIGMRVGKYIPMLRKISDFFSISFIRKFHNVSSAVMVTTDSVKTQLKLWHITAPINCLVPGVSTDVFFPSKAGVATNNSSYPIALYVGRIAIEKNIEAFLRMHWSGSKVVVGDGPDLQKLKKEFPDVYFVGEKHGSDLAEYYRGASVFVFPSKTETFGLVMIEALACGLPVAAYNVSGPKDIISEPCLGVLGDDLADAACCALTLQGMREERYAHVCKKYAWNTAAQRFLEITKQATFCV